MKKVYQILCAIGCAWLGACLGWALGGMILNEFKNTGNIVTARDNIEFAYIVPITFAIVAARIGWYLGAEQPPLR